MELLMVLATMVMLVIRWFLRHRQADTVGTFSHHLDQLAVADGHARPPARSRR